MTEPDLTFLLRKSIEQIRAKKLAEASNPATPDTVRKEADD